MRHLNDLINEEWFFAKEWILLCTGPSLDNFDYHKYKDRYNICALYDAAYACDEVDLLFVPDDLSVMPEFPRNSQRLATRSINIKHNLGDFYYWEYDCDIKNAQNGHSYFQDKKVFPCSNSSSLIVYWFGINGIKKLRTCGIDGGRGISKFCSEWYRNGSLSSAGWNPDIENEGVFGHATNFGVELIKI